MIAAAVTGIWLVLPVLFAGCAHMAVVRFDLLSVLKIPIHAQLFGAHKTWRGVLLMPVFAILGVHVASLLGGREALTPVAGVSTTMVGALLGLAYVLAELPNSRLKRALGVPPGKLPRRGRAWFALLDHTDSVVGCVLVYVVLLRPALAVVIGLLFIAPMVHVASTVGLYIFGLRKEPL